MDRVLHLDFESFSHVDLAMVGAAIYAADPSTLVTVTAWAFDNGPVFSNVWPATKALPPDIDAHLAKGGVISAHNASFERAILNGVYGADIPLEAFDCTMQRALHWGLPAALGEAGRALSLGVVKDESERLLMRSMAKPRKGSVPPWHEADPLKLLRLEKYCRQDVEAERALGGALPPLTARERSISLLDGRANDHGVAIDRLGVANLSQAAMTAMARIDAEAFTLTRGRVRGIGTATPALKIWLSDQGVHLPDLTKETVTGALDCAVLTPAVRRVLELRSQAARSSLKKLSKMAMTSVTDGRARGLLQYYGAGRTGRWAGRLIQVQNLPRPEKWLVPEVVHRTLVKTLPRALPGMLYPDPLRTISLCLRSCLVSAPGKVLLSLDLSQIEARVLAWLAGQADVLEAFRNNLDVYTLEAAKQGSTDRQFGKVLVLSCGFGAGAAKVREMAVGYGVTLSEVQAIDAVRKWRDGNPRIRAYWYAIEEAVLAALGLGKYGRVAQGGFCPTGNYGGVQTLGRIKLRMVGGVLAIKKPSGDKLYYHGMRWVPGRGLEFDGVDQKTGRWGAQYTYGGKLVENITQGVARDVLADALLRIETRWGYVPVMTVHDEAVYEILDFMPGAQEALIQTLFEEVPAWGQDLPIASDTRVGWRYGK